MEYKRISITFFGPVLDGLKDSSYNETRTLPQQVVVFVKEGLERRGYLANDQEKPIVSTETPKPPLPSKEY